MKITIHTPSAGIRAISIDGKSGRYEIRTDGKWFHLVDTFPTFGVIIATNDKIRPLEFALREYLAK